jgi:hypothetical protein
LAEKNWMSESQREAALKIVAAGKILTVAGVAREMERDSSALYNQRRMDADFRRTWDEHVAAAKAAKEQGEVDFPDFLTWRERFMGYYLPNGDVVRAPRQWFHDQAYAGIMANNRVMVLVPPMHMKTSIWSIEFSTYLIMKNRKTRITVIQKSQDEAKKIVREVKQRLTNHDFYQGLGIPIYSDPITLYGGDNGFKPDKYGGEGLWNADAFTVRDVGWGEKDPTMQAKGAESSILSIRSDYIIMDDIQDGGDYTPQSTQKLVDWVQLRVLTRLGPESRLVVLGSRLGPGDMYEEIMRREAFEDWPIIKFPAAFSPGTHDPWDPAEGLGEPLLPDLWPWDKLMAKRKEVGKAWHSAYMQEEGDRDGAIFSRATLEAARNFELRIGHIPEPVTHVYIGMDPAIVNWNVIVVWGLDKRTGIRYLIDVIRRKGLVNWDNVMDLLAEASSRYGPRKVCIEVNNTQGHVADTARRVLGALGFQVSEYKTATGVGARAEDQDYSISSIGALFDASLVQLPYGDDASRKLVDAFIEEFVRWHVSEDGTSVKRLVRDQVMATLFAESEARVEMRMSNELFKPKPRRMFATNGAGGWRWHKSHAESRS